MKPLFTSVQIGPLSLPNRVVMAPMTRSRALGNVPNELMAKYYSLRAEAGLLITEGTSPSPDGLGYARIPGLYSEAQVAGWRRAPACSGPRPSPRRARCGPIAKGCSRTPYPRK